MKNKNVAFTLFNICFLCYFTIASFAQTNDNSTKQLADSTKQISKREIKIQKGQLYLNFPISDSRPLKTTRILADGKVLDEFTLGLSEGEPDFWTFFDVLPYQGKTITVESENLGNAEKGFDKIFADTHFPGEDSLYREKLRPQVHFSSQRGWNNDVNGPVYYNGEYHLFYQHNPYGWKWGNMHWGHAVSKDLLQWKEMAEALYTPDHSHMAFSGTATTDPKNTSGFRKNGIDPLIAAFTSTGRGECLALSYDNGRTFKDYDGNPVLKHKGRDPKVFWYQPGNHWVMVVYDESHTRNMDLDQKAVISQNCIYTSPDLKNWTYQSGIPGFFECPDLFEMKVEGQPGVTKWVMYGGDGKYVVGNFDGNKFTMEQNFKMYDYGGAFYASQTFNNIPESDRRIQMGWARVPMEGMPFNQCMSFPTQLSLKKTANGFLLCPKPIAEISSLYKGNYSYENKILTMDSNFTAPVNGDVVDVIAEFERGDAYLFGLNVNGYNVAYNNLSGGFINFPGEIKRENYSKANKTNYVVTDPSLFKIEVIADKSIMEIFVNDGELYFVIPYNSVEAEKKIEVFAFSRPGQKTILKKLEVHKLNPIWPQSKEIEP